MAAFIRSWWFLGIILLLVAVVVAALIYGITTHTEPGLMASTPGFTRADLPITVLVTAYSSDDMGPPADEREAAQQAVARAVATLNERLGFGALTMDGPHPNPVLPPIIGVTIGTPTERGTDVIVDPGGAAMFHAGGRECYVTTTNTGTDAMLELVLEHELGHCLGLDHDCWAGSVMCGGSCCTLEPSPDGQYPPRIDDTDRALLRDLLAP